MSLFPLENDPAQSFLRLIFFKHFVEASSHCEDLII